MRFAVLLFVLSSVAACGGTTQNGGGGDGAGGDGAGGQAGGGSGPGPARGTLGGACTASSCDAPLECDTTAAGGYCTRACTAESDCPGGHCYRLGQGAFCLASCVNDAGCRDGYTCQGDAGLTVCFPGQGGGGGCLDVSQLVGAWTPGCGGGCEELRFSADGSVYYGYYTVPSGNTESYGTWQAGCPALTVDLTRGYWAPVTYRYTLTANGFTDDSGRAWSKCGDTCF